MLLNKVSIWLQFFYKFRKGIYLITKSPLNIKKIKNKNLFLVTRQYWIYIVYNGTLVQRKNNVLNTYFNNIALLFFNNDSRYISSKVTSFISSLCLPVINFVDIQNNFYEKQTFMYNFFLKNTSVGILNYVVCQFLITNFHYYNKVFISWLDLFRGTWENWAQTWFRILPARRRSRLFRLKKKLKHKNFMKKKS